jgi:uncharacterized membrane protein (DUF485 family)
MGQDLDQRIKSSPSYRELVSARRAYFRTILSVILVVYVGYFVSTFFDLELLAAEIGNTGMTWLLPIGIFVTAFIVVATAGYMRRANQAHARLTAEFRGETL